MKKVLFSSFLCFFIGFNFISCKAEADSDHSYPDVKIDAVLVSGKTFTGSADNAITYNNTTYKGCFGEKKSYTVNSFYIGKYKITKKQYKAIMSDKTLNTIGISVDPSFATNYPAGQVLLGNDIDDERPIENVNWYEAVYFCNLLSIKDGLNPAYKISNIVVSDKKVLTKDAYTYYTVKSIESAGVGVIENSNGWRLPFEEEWEFAARGGDPNDNAWKNAYSGSDSIDDVCWYRYNLSTGQTVSTITTYIGGTRQVGLKNHNSLGLYDMSGNVWEWSGDYYNYDSGVLSIDKLHHQIYRQILGGSYHQEADVNKVSYRHTGNLVSTVTYNDLGLRVVRSAN